MKDYIDAPMPFIIGISQNLWKSIKKSKESLPADIIIFNLDKNKVTSTEKLVDLPPRAAEAIYSTMLSIIDERELLKKQCKSQMEYKQKVLFIINKN